MRPSIKPRRYDPWTARMVVAVTGGMVVVTLATRVCPLLPQSAELHGRVTVADKPVTAAVVVVVGADGVPVTVPLDDAGRYHVSGLVPGPVKLAVQGRDNSAIANARAKALARSNRLSAEDKKKTADQPPELPLHVGDPARSGLQIEARGVTRFDIRLEP